MSRAAAPLSLNAQLRFDAVRRLLPASADLILEIGCGQGGFGTRLSSRGRYVGIDRDQASVRVAAERLRRSGGHVVVTDLRGIREEARFDLVCAFEVLEHIEDDASALAEWVQHVRPGGRLMVSVPAFADRYGPFDEMVGHYRRYDPRVIRQLFTNLGLTEITVRLYGGPLGYVLEIGRNRLATRRVGWQSQTMGSRTAGSGRLLQPHAEVVGVGTAAISLPFRALQRVTKNGPGLVAVGRLESG